MIINIKKRSQISVEIIEQEVIKSITSLNDLNKSYHQNLSYKDNFVQELNIPILKNYYRPNNISR